MTALRIKAVVMMAAGFGLYRALDLVSGAGVWLLVTLALLFFIGGFLMLAGSVLPSARRWSGIAVNTLVALAATGVMFAVLELALQLYESVDHSPPAVPALAGEEGAAVVPPPGEAWTEPDIDPEVGRIIAARGSPLTLPEAWKQRRAEVPGARKAYYWHDVLHVRDENRFRRTEPFPAKKAGTFRVMVVGDSLTFGIGIGERWTYPAVLQRKLQDEFNIEILNLGISGWNSEAILGVIETWTPRLDPDLVLYGMCLNDFLPSDVKQEVYDTAYALPLPRRFSRVATQQTRLGALLADRYDALLRKWGLRKDFFDGILADLEGHQKRFAKDVAAMNAFVTSRGLPPVIGMVLHQQPRYEGRAYRLARIAEQAMQHAGFTVVPTEDYFRRYDSRNMAVSHWEGHPNEEANQIFAAMFESRLRQYPGLEAYRRSRVEEHRPD